MNVSLCRLLMTWMVKNWMEGRFMLAVHRRKESVRMSWSANLSRWNRIAWPDIRFDSILLNFCSFRIKDFSFRVCLVIVNLDEECFDFKLQFILSQRWGTLGFSLHQTLICNKMTRCAYSGWETGLFSPQLTPFCSFRVSICTLRTWMMVLMMSVCAKNSLHLEP